MADEATINASLIVRKYTGGTAQIDYAGRPTTYRADVDGDHGPAPGTVLIGLSHTVIDLSAVLPVGLCRLFNQDADHSVEVGLFRAGAFDPLLELLPGEVQVVRLSRYLGLDLDPGTGTGTAGSSATYLAAKAVGAPLYLEVNAFPR